MMESFVPSYYVSVDLGKRQDFTAISILEEPIWLPDEETRWRGQLPDTVGTGWVAPAMLPTAVAQTIRRRNVAEGRPAQPPLRVLYLERVPLGVSYPQIVARVHALLTRPPVADDCVLLVDASGVGQPVVDEFELRGLQPHAITITGGNEVTQPGVRRFNTPKSLLVSALQAALGGRRLQFADDLPDLATLLRELEAFDLSVTEKMHDTYEGRAGEHDDLVLSVAQAVWFRGWFCKLLDDAVVGYAGGVA